ncbi:DUF4435 domain-containing protein [Rhizobium sp. EC-SD404]|uniref:DUF4435 domain-containing protein n=1 Tax=Rhizobium sp. EC-SD404 TaxID=2038389 RepID=UPI0018FE59B6|nr:DUF4435 domain-containing protein [Rhizobium sp. EC-SD404]
MGYAALYASLNEKTIFVEDAKGRIIHERIVESIIGPGRVRRIIPLNGRLPLLKEWEKNKLNDNNLYILDGDLNLLWGEEVDGTNIVQIDAYCVENIIINELNFRKLLEDYDLTETQTEEIITSIKVSISEISDKCLGLFILYAIAFRIRKIKTVSDGILRFCSQIKIEKNRVDKRKRELISAIIKEIGFENFKNQKELIKNNILSSSISRERFISGKDFILPMVHKIVESKAAYKGPSTILARQLSRHVRPNDAGNYRDFIRRHFP